MLQYWRPSDTWMAQHLDQDVYVINKRILSAVLSQDPITKKKSIFLKDLQLERVICVSYISQYLVAAGRTSKMVNTKTLFA